MRNLAAGCALQISIFTASQRFPTTTCKTTDLIVHKGAVSCIVVCSISTATLHVAVSMETVRGTRLADGGELGKPKAVCIFFFPGAEAAAAAADVCKIFWCWLALDGGG